MAASSALTLLGWDGSLNPTKSLFIGKKLDAVAAACHVSLLLLVAQHGLLRLSIFCDTGPVFCWASTLWLAAWAVWGCLWWKVCCPFTCGYRMLARQPAWAFCLSSLMLKGVGASGLGVAGSKSVSCGLLWLGKKGRPAEQGIVYLLFVYLTTSSLPWKVQKIILCAGFWYRTSWKC